LICNRWLANVFLNLHLLVVRNLQFFFIVIIILGINIRLTTSWISLCLNLFNLFNIYLIIWSSIVNLILDSVGFLFFFFFVILTSSFRGLQLMLLFFLKGLL